MRIANLHERFVERIISIPPGKKAGFENRADYHTAPRMRRLWFQNFFTRNLGSACRGSRIHDKLLLCSALGALTFRSIARMRFSPQYDAQYRSSAR